MKFKNILWFLIYLSLLRSNAQEQESIPFELRFDRIEDGKCPEQWPRMDSLHTYSLNSNATLNPGDYLLQLDFDNIIGADTLFVDMGYHRIVRGKVEIVYQDGRVTFDTISMFIPFSKRKYAYRQLLIPVPVSKGEHITCRMRITTREFFTLPIHVAPKDMLFESMHQEDKVFVLFAGIFLSMILYNFFIYLATKERLYLVYVCYHFFMSYSQLALFGLFLEHVWSEHPEFDYWIYMCTGSLVGTFGCLFVANFLEIKKYSIKLHRVIMVIGYSFPVYLLLDLFGFYVAKEYMYDFLGIVCITLFYTAIYISIKKGNLQTKFLLVGWSLFMFGYICFILKNEGVLPYNLFTHYAMITGSAMEMLLLSFALAHRINTLRYDNEKKQQEIIKQLETNELFLRKSKQLELDKERLKKEILISEYESLKKQINPHFLFNSLNVLSDLVHEEQTLAETFVAELAKVYRYILDCEQESLVALETELEFIRSYVFLLKIRFEENLLISVDLQGIKGGLIAPLTLQLLVENAVKHNIVSSTHPLKIDIYKEGDYIVVVNNYQVRRDREKSMGKGLKNIMSRYQYMTDLPVVVLQEDQKFVVKIPQIFARDIIV